MVRAGISRRDRVALFLHRGLDRRLSPLGVWVYRPTNGRHARATSRSIPIIRLVSVAQAD